jgi:hypothetical protein
LIYSLRKFNLLVFQMDFSETICDAENHEDKNNLIEQLKFDAVAKLLNSVELRAKYRLGLKGRLSRAKTLQVYSQIFEPNIPIVDILNATGGVPATGLDADSDVTSESEEECLTVGDNDDTHEDFEPINSASATLGSVDTSNVCSKKNTVVNIASKTSSDSLQEVTQMSVVTDDLQNKPTFESQLVSHGGSLTVNVCPESNLGEFSDDLRILSSQSVNLCNEQDADINSSVLKGNNLPKTVLHGISESLNSAAIERVCTSRAEGISLNVLWQECDEHNSLVDAALSPDNSNQRALTKSTIKQQLERRRKEALRKRLDEAKKSKQKRYNEAPQARLRGANKNKNLRMAKLLKEQKSVARAAAAVHAPSSGRRKRMIKELQNQEKNKQGEKKQRRRKAKLTMNDGTEHGRIKKKRLSTDLTNFNATEQEAASNSTTIVDSSAHGETDSHSSGLLHFAEMCSQKQKGDAPGLNFLPFRKQFPLLNAGLDVCDSREDPIDVSSTNDAIVCFSCELVDAERAVSALQLQIKMKHSKSRKESVTIQPVIADTRKTSNVQVSDETASGICCNVIEMVARASDVTAIVMADVVNDSEPLGEANETSVCSVNSTVTSCTKDMPSHLTQVCEPPSAVHSSTDDETAVEHDSVNTTSLVAEDIQKVAKTTDAAMCDLDKDASEIDSDVGMLEKEDVDSASGILTSIGNSAVDIAETAPIVTESMSTGPAILDIADSEGCDQNETVMNDNDESSHIVASDDTVVEPTSRPSQSQLATDVINTGHSAGVNNEGVEMAEEGGREPERRSVSDLWRQCQGDMADIRRRTEEISRQNGEILEELRRMEQAFSRLYEVLVNSSLIAGSRRHDYSNNGVFAGDGSSSSREILVTRQQPATFSSPDSLSQLPPLSHYAGDRRSIELEPKLNCSLPAHSKGSSHSLHLKERESSSSNEEALDLTMPLPKQAGIQPPPKQIGYILPTCQQPTLSENSLQGIANQTSEEDVETLDTNALVTGDNGASTLVDDDTMSVHTITLPLKDSSDGTLMPIVEMSEVEPDMGNFMTSASRFEHDENEKSRQATFVFKDCVSKNDSTSSSSVRGFSSENTVIDLTASSLSTSAANLSVTSTSHNFVPLLFSPAATSVTTTVASSVASSSAAVAVAAATHLRTARDSPQTSKGQGHHRFHASISGAGPSTTVQHSPISRVSTDRRSEPHHSRNSITPRPQVIVTYFIISSFAYCN